MAVCPITSRVKDYRFEVTLPVGLPVARAVLTDQVKSIDRHARRIEPIGRVPDVVVEEVQARVAALLGLDG
jgi:mRNA interferase MazF